MTSSVAWNNGMAESGGIWYAFAPSIPDTFTSPLNGRMGWNCGYIGTATAASYRTFRRTIQAEEDGAMYIPCTYFAYSLREGMERKGRNPKAAACSWG